MRFVVKALAAIATVVLLTAPAFAELFSPAGIWTTGGKDSRYELTLCGDGDELCGKLVWLKDDNPDLTPYLNKMILDNAARIGDQKWRGKVEALGHTARGTITLVDRNNIEIKACNGAVCGTIDLHRVR